MAIDSNVLLTHCQLALGVTQKELGDLIGVSKRTIQRWQDRGCNMCPSQAELLADALRPTRPDLADHMMELAKKEAKAMRHVTPELVDRVMQAAAGAGGIGVEAARSIVTAALVQAADLDLDLQRLVAKLTEG